MIINHFGNTKGLFIINTTSDVAKSSTAFLKLEPCVTSFRNLSAISVLRTIFRSSIYQHVDLDYGNNRNGGPAL